MTIGAVSSYQYSSNVQYQYFGTTVSTDRLTQLMEEYGVQKTGDSQTDLQALYQAMYSTASTEVTESQKGAQNNNSSNASDGSSTNIPWASLMGQVGLMATGDLATDYATFNSKISEMQSSATSQDQQASVSLLQAEASTVFVQQSGAAGASSQGQQTQVSGADITAQLNKLYLFGG